MSGNLQPPPLSNRVNECARRQNMERGDLLTPLASLVPMAMGVVGQALLSWMIMTSTTVQGLIKCLLFCNFNLRDFDQKVCWTGTSMHLNSFDMKQNVKPKFSKINLIYPFILQSIYQKYVSGSIQVLIQVDSEEIGLSPKSLTRNRKFISFRVPSYDSLERLWGKTRKVLFF